MTYTPTLLVHIFAGTLGLLSGTAAIIFKKGSRRHVLAGRVFVVSMLTMAVFAVYLAAVRHDPNNISGGPFPPQLARPDTANNKKRAHIVKEKALPFMMDLRI